MKQPTRADLAMTVAILFLGASLVFSGISLLRLRWSSIDAAQPLNLAELLGVGCAGAGIVVLGWWLLALVCACVSAVAQALGAVRLAAFTGGWSPAFMRRVVIAVLGMNLIATPLAGAAEDPGVDPRWTAGTVATSPAPVTESVPDPLPAQTSAPVEPRWVPRTAATDPDLLIRPSSRPEPSAAGAGSGTGATTTEDPVNRGRKDSVGTEEGVGTEVVVQSGDSLWSIVATALGPFSTDVDVALAWPGWYQANRGTIGPDPNFILPGQVLHAPSGT